MFSRLNASAPRALLRRSFAALPPPPPPPAARSRQGLALATLSAGILLGGYVFKADRSTVSLLSAPLMLESPVSTPKSTEAPIPSQPPSTTAKTTDQSSQIGKGPVVEGRESAERTGGSEFSDVDVAGDSVGGTKPDQDGEAAEAGEGSAEGGSSKGTGDPATQGAFNEETGEINWDCPCLGGMPHGPCGPQFRAAFSCFVYSEEEPKGIECVEKFKDMQECFRAHPDVYGESDYEDDEAEPASLEAEQSALEPLESQLMDDPSKPFEGTSDERGELFAQDGGVTGEGIGSKTE